MNPNIIKTLNYIKRNGVMEGLYAVKERMALKDLPPYEYKPIAYEKRLEQLSESMNYKTGFSILVPAYETRSEYLSAMISSVTAQTYANWELIIADASSTSTVKETVEQFTDARIRYVKLDSNKGIAENTNEGLKYCTKEYTGLLDHDDLLSEDALFLMAKNIAEYEKKGIKPQLIYSDEDKTDGENAIYFDPNIKPNFNLDLIMSNNYICHFLVFSTIIGKKLGFRKEYDGAQDHDFILRFINRLMTDDQFGQFDYKDYILHIGKVLYHWRCHLESTALNPKAKSYAYDAGERAVQDFANSLGYNASVRQTQHVGFFYVDYKPDIFASRPKVAAIGCRVINKGCVIDGIYDEDMNVMFEGLDKHNSGGILHRAHCQMEVYAVNVRYMIASDDGMAALSELMNTIDESEKDDYVLISRKYAEMMHERGYIFVYDPMITMKAI